MAPYSRTSKISAKDPNYTLKQSSNYHYAQGRAKVVRLLMQNGISPPETTPRYSEYISISKSAVLTAASEGHFELLKLYVYYPPEALKAAIFIFV